MCPIIDVISDDTFEYMAGSDMTYGGFNWKLNFRWYPVPQREMDRRKGDRTLPVRWVPFLFPPSIGGPSPQFARCRNRMGLLNSGGLRVIYLVRSLVSRALELIRARQSSPPPALVSDCP